MSKITFRADDDLVERLEDVNASKSEVMREALREFLDRQERPGAAREEAPAVDDALVDAVDEIVRERLDHYLDEQSGHASGRDVNVNITVDGAATAEEDGPKRRDAPVEEHAQADHDEDDACGQCGETLDGDHVYCPNCGEKQARRVFCDCGDEIRTDWAFCPSCGRRTPAADVLDRS